MMDNLQVHPGSPHPLGAIWNGEGVNFALFTEHATKVELYFFETPEDKNESHRIELPERSNHVFHGYLPGIKSGQLYGYTKPMKVRYPPVRLITDLCEGLQQMAGYGIFFAICKSGIVSGI